MTSMLWSMLVMTRFHVSPTLHALPCEVMLVLRLVRVPHHCLLRTDFQIDCPHFHRVPCHWHDIRLS